MTEAKDYQLKPVSIDYFLFKGEFQSFAGVVVRNINEHWSEKKIAEVWLFVEKLNGKKQIRY